MPATVTSLARYPVKGLSPERVDFLHLEPGHGVEGDRAFALALPDTDFDEKSPRALPKTKFLMLARQEALARLSTRYDPKTRELSIVDGTHTLIANTRTPDGVEKINRFFAQFLPESDDARTPRFVRGVEHRFTDVGVHSPSLMNSISILNLASLRDVEQKLGRSLDPRRFRMNILIDGLRPWEEMDWIDRDLTIGNLSFRGVRLTRRCPATEVNPDTAIRDVELPKELLRTYGHVYLGLYVTVQTGGFLTIGDTLTPPAR
jgi:uncharacterized protein